MRRVIVAAWALAVASVLPAAAQDSRPALTVGAGGTVVLGDARSSFGDGWNVDAGVTFRLTDALGLRVDGLYSRFGSGHLDLALALPATATPSQEGTITAKHQFGAAAFDLVFNHAPAGGRTLLYVMGGPSIFHRRVNLTGTGQGMATFCKPLWFQCEPGPVSFDQAIGIRSENDFGVNVGAGVTFEIGLTARMFIEARYMRVFGREFTGPSGPASSSASYFPITAGLRF
jgi:opacity protein-like surface antigen